MKKILLPFLILAILTACEKEQAVSPDAELEARTNDVWLCHKPEGQNPVSIWVDASSVEAHLAHGDVLLDADGDGYTAVNTCGEGSEDDCNDNDAAIHPGAEEVCGDNIDNDCDEDVDEDCGCPVIEGLLLVTLPDGNCLYVAPEDQKTGTPQSDGVEWGGFETDINDPIDLVNITTPEEALLDFAGADNTAAIVAQLGAGNYAAKVCEELNAYGYDDWYLPALGELKAVYDEHGGTGLNNFNGYYYWSSSEYSDIRAWVQNFLNGNQFIGGKNGGDEEQFFYTSCRCVRR